MRDIFDEKATIEKVKDTSMKSFSELLDSTCDIVIIGGGVTGAGVFHQAVTMGLSALLVEGADFAWGTSSRSSKMVHGGLRYLKQGRFLLTRAAVKERERLLKTYPGLVTPLRFTMPIYRHLGPSRAAMKLGLSIYSIMAGNRQHWSIDRKTVLDRIPGMNPDSLLSAVGFQDAQVDDARLVLRLIFDACDMGGCALNYTRATEIIRNARGDVAGVRLFDVHTKEQMQVNTPVVINASGVCAEQFHLSPVKDFHIRPLRGSHLVFPGHVLPLETVISFIHPRDSRPVFLFPWEGSLFLGTTDVDHAGNLNQEPAMTRTEADYLMEGLRFLLPGHALTRCKPIASIAGVRAVLSRKHTAASKESREHVVWQSKGLVTVTGGKLTTFRLLAHDAIKAAAPYLPRRKKQAVPQRVPERRKLLFDNLDPAMQSRILGRYGARAGEMCDLLSGEGSHRIGDTQTVWAEVIHGARAEKIYHLQDLLLRRVRIGLLLPRGGMEIMDQIKARVSPWLDWDETRWETEISGYQKLWDAAYSPVPKNE